MTQCDLFYKFFKLETEGSGAGNFSFHSTLTFRKISSFVKLLFLCRLLEFLNEILVSCYPEFSSVRNAIYGEVESFS